MISGFKNLPICPILSKLYYLDMSKFVLKSTQTCILKTTYFNQIHTNVERRVLISTELKMIAFEYFKLFLIHINQISVVLKLREN